MGCETPDRIAYGNEKTTNVLELPLRRQEVFTFGEISSGFCFTSACVGVLPVSLLGYRVRVPLSAITSGVEMLMTDCDEGALQPEQQEVVRDLFFGCKQLRAILDNGEPGGVCGL